MPAKGNVFITVPSGAVFLCLEGRNTMKTASVAFQVMPRVSEGQDAILMIDKAIDVVKQSGVTYEVGPMETTMEGELDALIEIVHKSIDACMDAGAQSVFTNMKILYDPKGVMTIYEKVTKHRSK
jgi:uncharacterized protein YqgV (UPF0045/DUF77 family)